MVWILWLFQLSAPCVLWDPCWYGVMCLGGGVFSDLMIQSQYFGVPASLGLHKCLSSDTHYSPPVLRGWSGRNTLPPTGMRLFFLGELAFVMWTLVCVKLLQGCLTLCGPMDCSFPGSSVHGILQARILEWDACPPHVEPLGVFYNNDFPLLPNYWADLSQIHTVNLFAQCRKAWRSPAL